MGSLGGGQDNNILSNLIGGLTGKGNNILGNLFN